MIISDDGTFEDLVDYIMKQTSVEEIGVVRKMILAYSKMAIRELPEMMKQEKIEVCYQHACLVYEVNKAINNKSVRERFGIDKNQSSVASRIIADTLEAQKIKLPDESITSNCNAVFYALIQTLCVQHLTTALI